MKILALLLLAVSSFARADDIINVGFGPSLDGTTNPKEFAVGYEKTWGEFGIFTHCGLLFESDLNGYCAIIPGVHIETASGIFSKRDLLARGCGSGLRRPHERPDLEQHQRQHRLRTRARPGAGLDLLGRRPLEQRRLQRPELGRRSLTDRDRLADLNESTSILASATRVR